MLYRNDAGTFIEADCTGIDGIRSGSVAWGDFDNDGDLDILITGYGNNYELYLSKVIRNDGGNFRNIGENLKAVGGGSAAWGDYDHDGDLDILLAGNNTCDLCGDCPTSRVYRNDAPAPDNTPPAAPTNLSAQLAGSTLTFSWDPATDAETPAAGLTYNLRVGTTPGGGEICSAMAEPGGYRTIPALGNTNHENSWTLDVPGSEVYYWSVQAVDTAFEGSPFAVEEMIYTITGVPGGVLPAAFALRPNAPNPFNPMTTIGFDLPESRVVSVEIFDLQGRRVRSLVSRVHMPGGVHRVVWRGVDDSGRGVASGSYFCRLSAGGFVQTQRMTLVK